MQQYFVNKINDKFILKDEDFYHITTVLRYRDKKIICISDGSAYLCSFKYDGNEYDIEIIEKLERNTELPVDVYLYQALIRNENFDLVLQKATELGAAGIAPTIFTRNVVKIEKSKEENKMKRFEAIVKNASEQSHREIVPEILSIINVKDIALNEGEIGIVCYEKDSNTKALRDIKDKLLTADKIKIVIGPEGGIEEAEYSGLLNKGFYSISLGKRILRSETAAMNILSKIGYLTEEDI